MLCGLQQFSLSLRNLLLPTILVLQSAKVGQVDKSKPRGQPWIAMAGTAHPTACGLGNVD